jgi:hypothetical protein
MSALLKLGGMKAQRLTSLLGLTLDGGRLEGVVVRRTNGSLAVQQSFSVALSLDPLTNDAELVGREIRNHLDAAGVRERRCVVGLPLKWALTTYTKVPDLPDADVPGFLQIEAERGFPCDVETLLLATSRFTTAGGEKHATLVGIPRNHVALLQAALEAAQLKPVSFSLGLTALQSAEADPTQGVMALAIGESQVGLLVACGGGVAALRALEGALETEPGQRVLHADVVTREARITLGQLPADLRADLRAGVHRVRIFGPRDLAQQLADEIELRLEAMELKVELASAYAPGELGLELPAGVPVSAAFSLAAAILAGRKSPFEFLPPKVTALQQLAKRYASGKLRTAGVAAAAAACLVVGLFLFQQIQLIRLRTRWVAIEPKVRQLEAVQQQIRQYRPWFDESFRALSILRQVSTAFPEDGSVTAKSVEIRAPNLVTCSGTARDNGSWLTTLDKLRRSSRVSDLKVIRVQGKSPMQFTFDFHWVEGGSSAN